MFIDFGSMRSFIVCFQAWVSHATMSTHIAPEPDSRVHCCRTTVGQLDTCSTTGRETQTVVADLDGTLTRSRSSFPYFMLVAYEAGSPLRGLLLLILSPLVWLSYYFISEAAGIRLLIFVSFAGLKASAIADVARAVLCRFYLEDMHSQCYQIFISCGKKYVVTANPTLMVEPFLKDYLGVNHVMGTDIHTVRGYCTGFVRYPGVIVGINKRNIVKEFFKGKNPDLGLGDRPSDYPFLALCKEAYIVPEKPVEPVPRERYPKPLVFHDGRLAMRPTQLTSVVIFLWLPVGFMLAVVRLIVGFSLPMAIAIPLSALLGVRMRVKGAPPCPMEPRARGMLYVCSHRTLMDPVFLSVALRRKVAAVTYSVSRLSEFLSPIKTVRLTRCRAQDAKTIQTLLEEGDLVICPEGTTCREPYLLRFSSLFAELTDDIVPVTLKVSAAMFHGTTARGFKGMDPFYFLMNPWPHYTVTFLDPLPKERTCSAGFSSIEVANYVQQEIAQSMGFRCTNFTRKDKYMTLAGHDGIVPSRQLA